MHQDWCLGTLLKLSEIMVGVAIIGVLGVTAVPQYQKYQRNAIGSALQQDVATGSKAYIGYQATAGDYCGDMSLEVDKERSVGLKAFYDQGGEVATPANMGTPASPAKSPTNPNYSTNGSFGFGSFSATGYTTCTGISAISNVQFFDQTTSTNAPHSSCFLAKNGFKLGAFSGVSGYNQALFVDENGRINKPLDRVADATSGKACCDGSATNSAC